MFALEVWQIQERLTIRHCDVFGANHLFRDFVAAAHFPSSSTRAFISNTITVRYSPPCPARSPCPSHSTFRHGLQLDPGPAASKSRVDFFAHRSDGSRCPRLTEGHVRLNSN